MKIRIKIFFQCVILTLFSCEQREWNNPFDPDCPKEIFTPTSFTASQEGSSIKLNWVQLNNRISGFILLRKINDGTWHTIDNLSKELNSWTDNNIEGGINYGYKLIALANNNESNEKLAYITPKLLPTVQTLGIINKNVNSIVCGGNVIKDGGSIVFDRGLCLDTVPNPTIADRFISLGSGIGNFTDTIAYLDINVNIYLKAYATNEVGTSYGDEVTVILYMNSPGPNITDIDGNTYKSVKIGDQIWMAENLKTAKYRDGKTIPYITDGTTWAELRTGAYCYFLNSTSIGSEYGPLYNFYAVINSKRICPSGWHVPSDDEWNILRNYLGGENVAGGKLKEKGIEHWEDPNVGADNSSGFTALAASWRGTNGSFYYNVRHSTFFWTSSKLDSINAYYYSMGAGGPNLSRGIGNTYHKTNAGHSIRCIKD